MMAVVVTYDDDVNDVFAVGTERTSSERAKFDSDTNGKLSGLL